MSRLTDKELQELEDLAKELEELEFQVGGEDEDADAVLQRWKQYRKQEGYDEDSEADDDDYSEDEDDDPHKYDGRAADPILEKSVDQLLEEDRKRWEEQERQWQEQEKQRQEAWQQQQILWQDQEAALARGTYLTDYGGFGYDQGAAGNMEGALVPAGQQQQDMYGYGNYGYGEDFYEDYYAYTYDIDMSEFDTEEYIRLYQEALALLEAQQKDLEEEEQRRKNIEEQKKIVLKEEEKRKKAEAAAAAGEVPEADDDSSEPEDSDEEVDDEEVFARMLENKRKKEEEMKKLAEQRAKVMLLGRAGKLPQDAKKKKKKKQHKGKMEASSVGLKVNAKTGKLRVPQGGSTIKINLKDAEAIKEIDGGCVIVMPKGFELTIKSKSRLAPRLKEVRDALLANSV